MYKIGKPRNIDFCNKLSYNTDPIATGLFFLVISTLKED